MSKEAPNDDVQTILDRAGVTPDQQDRVERAVRMLDTLPPAPTDLQREVVASAFEVFDVPARDIILAAEAELGALSGHLAERAEDVQRTRDQGDGAIATLERQIAEVRVRTAARVAEVDRQQAAARTTIAASEEILAFLLREAMAALVSELRA